MEVGLGNDLAPKCVIMTSRSPMHRQREELLDFALQLAKTAAEQIMPHYHNCVASTKPDGTEVTDAGRRAEEVVREMIADQFPERDSWTAEHMRRWKKAGRT